MNNQCDPGFHLRLHLLLFGEPECIFQNQDILATPFPVGIWGFMDNSGFSNAIETDLILYLPILLKKLFFFPQMTTVGPRIHIYNLPFQSSAILL